MHSIVLGLSQIRGLVVRVSTAGTWQFVFLHLDEKPIKLFHFLNAFLVFLRCVCVVLRCCVLGWFSPFVDYVVNCGRVDIVVQRRWVKFFQPVAELLFLRKLQEIFESSPLFVLCVYKLGSWCASRCRIPRLLRLGNNICEILA